MALQCYLDAFNIGTGAADTTVVRTGYGFQPKVCIYWWSGRVEAVPTFGGRSLQTGMGFATSPTARAAVTAMSVSGQGTMVTNRYHDNTVCIASTIPQPSPDAIEGLADLQSFDSAGGGGQTLVIRDSFAGGNLRIHCLALGGSDLTDAAIVQFQTPSTTGAQTQDITTVGFQPDAVLLMSAGSTVAPPAILASAEIGLGVMSGAGLVGTVAYRDADAQANAITSHYGYGGEALAIYATSTAPAHRTTLTSFLSNGFRLNCLANTSLALNIHCWALCLKGGSYLVGNLTTSTTLDATLVESGFGFAPTGCLLLSHGDVQSTQGTQVIQASLSLGAFTSPANRACQSVVSNNAAPSSLCGSSVNEDACLRILTNNTTSTGVVDVSTVDSNGFTLIMDVADVTTAKYVTYLAFGNGAAALAAKAPPPRRSPLRFARR